MTVSPIWVTTPPMTEGSMTLWSLMPGSSGTASVARAGGLDGLVLVDLEAGRMRRSPLEAVELEQAVDDAGSSRPGR